MGHTCKEAKFPDPIGLPLEYMKHHGVFDSKKTSEYDLCHFYQVGLFGDLPDFPLSHKPATHEWVSKFLLKARALGQPNLIVAHLQVRTACKGQPPAPANGTQGRHWREDC